MPERHAPERRDEVARDERYPLSRWYLRPLARRVAERLVTTPVGPWHVSLWGAALALAAAVWLAACLIVAGLGAVSTHAAWAASRVILLRAHAPQPLDRQAETLLAAELRASGFEVVSVDRRPGGDLRTEIEATTASPSLQPIASVAMVPVAGAAAAVLTVVVVGAALTADTEELHGSIATLRR